MAKSHVTEPARPLRARPARLPRLPAQLKAALAAAQGRKAAALVLLDLRNTGAFTDYFLLCTGGNPRQVQAIADAVEQALKDRKVRPAHIEGYERAEWILLDYFDFIVHIFSPQARQFYGLERLWGNAVRHDIAEDDGSVDSGRV
jgi:ribosome-associated protein